MKVKIDKSVIFTNGDALRYCALYRWMQANIPALDAQLAGIVSESYSPKAVMSARAVMAWNIAQNRELLEKQYPQFAGLPALVLASHATMDMLLDDPSGLQPILDGKISYEGLVSLCEKGRL